jgi:hypothetical protein
VLKEHGLGIWIYMVMLRAMMYWSLVAAVLVTPAFVCNLSNAALEDGESNNIFDTGTLANQGDNSRGYDGWLSFFQTSSVGLCASVVITSDLSITLAFVIAAALFVRKTTIEMKLQEGKRCYMSDFSIEIDGLPNDTTES